MAINTTWIQAGGYAAGQDRLVQAALLARSAPNTVRPGVLPSDGTDFAVTAQGTPNMTLNVGKGQVVIPDAAGGAYILENDATKVVTISAASGSNPRIDLIIARVYDNAAGDAVSTTTLALAGAAGNATVQTKTGDIEVVTGTPGATPAAPPLPNSPAGSRCVILKVVTVGTSVTSINNGNLADSGGSGTPATRIQYTAAAGSPLICRTSTDYPAAGVEGARIYDQSLNCDFVWSGTAWVPSDVLLMTDDAAPMFGSPWDGLTQKLEIKKRFTGLIAGGSGVFPLTFASAFPHGILHLQLTLLSNNLVMSIAPILSSLTLAGVNIQCLQSLGVGAANGLQPIVAYDVLGW